jgi:hypothetical protein
MILGTVEISATSNNWAYVTINEHNLLKVCPSLLFDLDQTDLVNATALSMKATYTLGTF